MFISEKRCWVQCGRLRLRVFLPIALMACGGMSLRAETPPKPSLRIPLSELGFPGYVLSLMHAGASMATVHMLDNTHVLFTYSLRSLVPRLPGDDINDSDRQVAAVLLEIPSGKVLARTKWHLHDHGPYLWNLGQGRFILRSGSELSVFMPMQAIARGEDPFLRFALPHRPGQPVLVEGSPDGRMVTVEIESEVRRAAGEEGDESRKKKHYTLEFFRVEGPLNAKDPLQVRGAGAVGSPVLLRLPLDGDGYLWAEDGERGGKWMVSFNEFGGKQQSLTPVMSSCHPRLTLLSRSQFLAETCRGSEQQPMLAAYGFDGHENWQEQFGEALQPPVLALAPEAGRFAMSRLVAAGTGDAGASTLNGDDSIAQEIRVYQTESGDRLLRLQSAPAVRTAENFDLSPDGRMLVVMGRQTLDLYRLPELTAKDRKDLAEVQGMTPPEGSGPVALAKITRPVDAPIDAAEERKGRALPLTTGTGRNTAAVGEPVAANDGAKASSESQPASAAAEAPAVAANPPTAVRKPPTLLNPGETPVFKRQSPDPK